MKEYMKTEFHEETWNNFQKLSRIARQGERVIINHLEDLGCNILEDGTVTGNKYYDVHVEFVLPNYKINDIAEQYEHRTYEIKLDFKSTDTNNFAVELIQNGKASGINSTLADEMIFVTPSGCTKYHHLTLVKTKKLKEHIKDNYKDYRTVEVGRTLVMLMPISVMKELGYSEYIELNKDTHFPKP